MYKRPPAGLLRAARIALGLNQDELSAKSGQVSPRTVYRVEKGEAKLESVLAVQEALKQAGLVFIDEDETMGPGFRLPKQEKARSTNVE